MSIKTRLIVALVLSLAMVGTMYACHRVYGIELGTSHQLAYAIALGKSPEKLSDAQLAPFVDAANIWFAIAMVGGAIISAVLIAIEVRKSRKADRLADPTTAWMIRAFWFVSTSGVFAALILGANYATYVWAMRLLHPKLTDWFFPLDNVYLVDGSAAVATFTLLRIPLWNAGASEWEARELAARWRRRAGEWIIGKGVIESEKEALKQETEGSWQREAERREQQAREDYARYNPRCPDPEAHKRPPKKTLRKRDLST